MSGSRPYTLDFRFRTKNCYPTNGIRKLWTLNRKHWRKSPDAGNATCGHMNVKTKTNQHKRCSKSKKNHFLLFEIWSFAVKEIAVVRKWRQNVRPVKISTTHNIWNANAFGSGSLACFLHFFFWIAYDFLLDAVFLIKIATLQLKSPIHIIQAEPRQP